MSVGIGLRDLFFEVKGVVREYKKKRPRAGSEEPRFVEGTETGAVDGKTTMEAASMRKKFRPSPFTEKKSGRDHDCEKEQAEKAEDD